MQAPEGGGNRVEPGDEVTVGDLTVHVRGHTTPIPWNLRVRTRRRNRVSRPRQQACAGFEAVGRVSRCMYGDQVIEATNDLRVDRLLLILSAVSL